ncbi:alpha-glucan family phosphorylase [Candidatus Beckwithbacteria bacterium]|nr:alpha-glucan family phosphorylase [Candidatus Beckwithbacteria bacterium]
MIEINQEHPVAYFCAEFGFDTNIPTYAGGLGVLAGDTVKEAADQGFPFVGVGLLYRGEQAVQAISTEGLQTEEDYHFDPLSLGLEHVYVDDMPFFVRIHLTEVNVWARCWKKTFAHNVTLYLLDTETDQNELSERSITHALYLGSEEALMKQQLILGIGGVKLLHALGIHPSIYHLNEGRPAFLHWQLIRSYMETHGIPYKEAAARAKAKTVYTNHTLVSAGNESYNIHILRTYGQYYADKMGISIDTLLEPGIQDNPDNFVMTRFALNTSTRANGVSQLHSKLSQEHWPEYNWTNVTNGVHMPTWQDPEIRDCNKDGNDLWQIHLKKKQELVDYLLEKTGFGFDPNMLIITWARRIALYKRPDELFGNVDQLERILKDQSRPVQLLIAGKAHAKDKQAKMLLQEAIHYMKTKLSGHALFIPNYNIEIAQKLTRGSDVWLNTPVMGMEASGTSGMKAISNGVLQCTVKDGWSAEVDWHGLGWVLDPIHITSSLYTYLDNEIKPMYYGRDDQGVPLEWLTRMKKSIELSGGFSATRMFNEYKEKLYNNI